MAVPHGTEIWSRDIEGCLAYLTELDRTNPPRQDDPAGLKRWGELLMFYRPRSFTACEITCCTASLMP